jgi:hypothetical protein
LRADKWRVKTHALEALPDTAHELGIATTESARIHMYKESRGHQ